VGSTQCLQSCVELDSPVTEKAILIHSVVHLVPRLIVYFQGIESSEVSMCWVLDSLFERGTNRFTSFDD
jgi:hypothetical protein